MFEHTQSANRQSGIHPAKSALRARVAQRLAAFGNDDAGGVAIMATLLMPVLVLGMGLGAETGYHYMTQRNLQHAADLAAHAGGVRLRAGDSTLEIHSAALHIATTAGFGAEFDSFDLNTPPSSGPNVGNADSVEVLLTRNQPRFFSAILSIEPVQISARAVAQVTPSDTAACVLALAPTQSRAITVSGNTDVSLDGCDVASNSHASDAFWMANSSANLTVGCVHSVGGSVSSTNLRLLDCVAPNDYAPQVRDPYADLEEPNVNVVPCETNTNVSVFEATHSHPSGVPAMRICGGLDIRSQVSFKPGLYIIDGGDLSLNANADVSPAEAGMSVEGATFFLTGNSRLMLSGNGGLNMQAPTSGPYDGILVFASRSQSGLTHQIRGNSGSTTQGALYAPTSKISFSGNSTTTNGCTQVIGYSVEFTGNSTLRSTCATFNARRIETNVMVRIVE
ncbi:pilus assembly protein TadG-related protein [Natronohydrobacter thiooxidans]|uniref:pilus assembly protein TadG-related protein n=1 Tax=Natronohydrobacter thiooxidans TaxID=87172 RepID=UPI0008FF215E|nr:pilus assembly protein TadG-related protein [Natronohydrobacter thiooxidans]